MITRLRYFREIIRVDYKNTTEFELGEYLIDNQDTRMIFVYNFEIAGWYDHMAVLHFVRRSLRANLLLMSDDLMFYQNPVTKENLLKAYLYKERIN